MAEVKKVMDIRICEWTASMYCEKKRVWFYGSLSLLPEEIVFQPSDKSADTKVTRIQYSNICKVEKTRTGLVYGAIYLLLSTNTKVWFSSLEDRVGVHEAIKHFWKSSLVGKENTVKKKQVGKTVMGQKLLGIVNDSQETLSTAAVQLHGQGQQFDHMLTNMFDIHNDLDIAENVLEDIDSWFGRWRLPDEYVSIDPVIINKSDIPEFFEYEILLTKLEASKMNARRIGTVRLSKDGITLLNSQMRTEHHYRWADVSYVRVITPWEIVLTQNKIGSPDLSYSLVSTIMVAVIRLLEKCVKYKMRYDTPPVKVLVTKHRQEQTQQNTGGNGECLVVMFCLVDFRFSVTTTNQCTSRSDLDNICETLKCGCKKQIHDHPYIHVLNCSS